MPTVRPTQAVLTSSLPAEWSITRHTNDTDEDDKPVPLNKKYDDGSQWEGGELASGFKHEFQIVTDLASRVSASARSFGVSRGVQIFVARDDGIITTYGSTEGGWVDSGRNQTIGQRTHSLWTKEFPAGTVTIPGNNGTSSDQQMVIYVVNGFDHKPNSSTVAASTGAIRWTQNSDGKTPNDLSGDFFIQVERYGGSDGAASCNIEMTTGSTEATLVTVSASWANLESGIKTISVTPSNVTGNQVVIFALTGFAGAGEGNRTSVQATIIDGSTSAPPPAESGSAAIHYYVNNVSGNDGNAGTSTDDAWATLGRAGAVTVHPSGQTWIHVYGGPYNQPINPKNGANSAGDAIVYRPMNADVVIQSTGQFGIICSSEHIHILRSSGFQFIIDGSANQTKNGSPGGSNGNIDHIGNMDRASACIFEFRAQNTVGWEGIETEQGSRNIYRCTIDKHGNPYNSDGHDFGDALELDRVMSANTETFIDGEWTDTEFDAHPGHNLYKLDSGRGTFRHKHLNGDWTDIATYNDGDEGHRVMVLTKDCSGWQVEDSIFEKGYVSQSQGNDRTDPIMKFAGHSHLMRGCFLIDGTRQGMNCFSNTANGDSLGHRFAHTVFAKLTNEGIGQSVGRLQVGDIAVKNSVFVSVSSNVAITLHGNGDWQNEIEIKGNLFPVNSQMVIQGAGGGTFDISAAQDTYANVSGNVFTNDPGFVNLTAKASFADVYTNFAPSAGSALINAGVPLTSATNAGTNTVNLDVADAKWFPRTMGWPAPTKGPYGAKSAYVVHIAGVGSVAYTTSNWGTGRITLASAQTWSSGAAIGYHASPDIGAVQT